MAIADPDRSAKLRGFYASYVTASARARDPRIAEAFAAVPREPFAGPGPWSIPTQAGYIVTPDDDPAFLYQNTLIAIDTARGIHIGEPSLHALMLDALALQPGETVLQVGTGVGYYTAILAHLVGATGTVHAFEIDAGLAARAAGNLAHLPSVKVHPRSGIADGLPRVDAIYVNAGITQPSWAWLDALRPGGRLMFGLQPPHGFGGVLLVERPASGAAWPARFVSPVRYIPAEARQDETMGRRLAAVFKDQGWRSVKSLRLAGEPDATCWVAGDDWWLSTEA